MDYMLVLALKTYKLEKDYLRKVQKPQQPGFNQKKSTKIMNKLPSLAMKLEITSMDTQFRKLLNLSNVPLGSL